MQTNRKYKDTVFTSLFNNRENLVELYNAIFGTQYPKDTNIEIITLDDVVFSSVKNDLAFVIDDKFIVLAEHQSTISDNLPLRMLIYIAREYEKIIDNKLVYREKLMKIPTPEFIVLYNGEKEFPLNKELRLSNSFMIPDKIHLELLVKVININYDKKHDAVNHSKTLKEYAIFVFRVRENIKNGMNRDEAIKKAVRDCIQDNVLRTYLEKNGSEVNGMMLAEFDMETAKEVWREEGREEDREEGREEGREAGREEGREEGREAGREEGRTLTTFRLAKEMLEEGLPIEQICKITKLDVNTVTKIKTGTYFIANIE